MCLTALWCFDNIPGEMTASSVAGALTPSEGTYITTYWHCASSSQIVGTVIQHLQKDPILVCLLEIV